MKKMQGFTLIELMIVVVIVAFLAAIAMPSYDQYIRKKNMAVVQQEMQKIANELERHKLKNFSYTGFTLNPLYPTGNSQGTIQTVVAVTVPATNPTHQVSVSIQDNGQKWAITATRQNERTHAKLKELFMTSTGVRCMNSANLDEDADEDEDKCGTDSENW